MVEIPKYCNNGCLVAKLRNKKVKRLSRKGVHYKRFDSGNGLPLTHNGEGEEIVYARLEREWSLA